MLVLALWLVSADAMPPNPFKVAYGALDINTSIGHFAGRDAATGGRTGRSAS